MKIIAGPCVIESKALLREVAQELVRIKETYNIEVYFKASFDKANRTNLSSFRGPGIEQGIAMLEEIREEFGLPITTDFHTLSKFPNTAIGWTLFKFQPFCVGRRICSLKPGKQERLSILKRRNF